MQHYSLLFAEVLRASHINCVRDLLAGHPQHLVSVLQESQAAIRSAYVVRKTNLDESVHAEMHVV